MRFKLFSASLLVAGTAIGAGMLALPVATAQNGFIPSLFLFFLCYLFMTATGLLLVEACLWLPKDANLVSLSRHLLGKWGKTSSWILYLFLFYCLTIAYVAGGGGFIFSVLSHFLSLKGAIVLFTALFAPFVFRGTAAVDRINLILMGGLILSYALFIFMGLPEVKVELLKETKWNSIFMALPIVFTSFSYQGIIPSLMTYLNRNGKMAKKAIIIGTTIPFVVYALWQGLILGIVPISGPGGLIEAKAQGLNAVIPLKEFLSSSWIYFIGQAFAFFALTTSFLGVTLGLLDFLADGLHLSKNVRNKLLLSLLVFVPPVVIAAIYPDIFITALSYAGGIGCALLLGLFPILMVWNGRYVKGLRTTPYGLKGGKPLLILMALFVIFEVAFEVLREFT